MKLFAIKVYVLFIKVLYTFMKLRKTQNKIIWLSRQSDKKSEDIRLLSAEIEKISPETKQVFRLRRLKDESGLSVSYIFSVFGDMWEMANARVAVTDTYSIPVSCLNHKKDLKVIQIWHALGAVKKFGLQSAGKAQGRDLGVAKAMHMHENYDVVVAPSEKTADFYCQAFGCTKDKIVVASLPRVDVILRGDSRIDEFIKLNPKYEGKKIIVYLPTFRNNDIECINRLYKTFASSTDYALIISPHPSTKYKRDDKIKGKFSTYDLAKLSDGIITDYSAISIECSLLGKPLWFYVPDYEAYKEAQGLNIELAQEVKSVLYKDENELLAAIESGVYDFDDLKRFSDKYIKNKGANNTEDLARIICDLL